MRIVAGDSGQEYILEFENSEEYETFFSNADEEGFFMLEAEKIPRNAVFRARAVGSPRSRKIKPVKVVKEGKHHRIWTVPPKAIPKLEGKAENKIESPYDRIRGLTINERVTLAIKADLVERRILAQENNAKIHEFLLRNPRLTESEIAAMARNPASPMQTILSIANHREWMNIESIRSAILTNPKTPGAMVIEMIHTLSAADLIKMHHAHLLREDVRGAVHREIKKRGIRVKQAAE